MKILTQRCVRYSFPFQLVSRFIESEAVNRESIILKTKESLTQFCDPNDDDSNKKSSSGLKI